RISPCSPTASRCRPSARSRLPCWGRGSRGSRPGSTARSRRAMEREDRLTAIWRQALQAETIGSDDDFFDLGGDSLMAVGLFLEIEREFGVKLPITAIYDAPTIAGQLALIEAESRPGFSHLVLLKDGDTRAPFFIVHGVGGTVMEFAGLGR